MLAIPLKQIGVTLLMAWHCLLTFALIWCYTMFSKLSDRLSVKRWGGNRLVLRPDAVRHTTVKNKYINKKWC